MSGQKLDGSATGTGPDWSALASANEKVVDRGSATATVSGQPAGRPWRGRAARAAAAGTAGILAVTGAATAASAAITPASSSWRTVKQVHGSVFSQFTAVTAAGRSGGWAFDGMTKPAAYERSGSTWKKIAFVSTGGDEVIAAYATSGSDAWAFTGSGGANSKAVHWNGHHWSVSKTFSGQLGGAAVISGSDVWVFGMPEFGTPSTGTWHYNGHSWSKVSSGKGLQGGSGLSSSSVWAYDGAKVAHWNGHTWTRTSVASLLPPKNGELNDPGVTAIYAQSKSNVWAVGNGNAEDDGGPLAVLHYNGHSWKRVAYSISFSGYGEPGQVAPDGHGGLWIPMPGPEGGPSHLVHYSGGHLTAASLPVSASKISVLAIAAIPHSSEALAGGFTHASGNLGSHVVAVILQYGG